MIVKEEKKTLLCGIQPTSSLTIGNYIGALLPLIENQNKYDSILLIADLHAYTIPLSLQGIGFKEIKNRAWELVKWAIASGVDPQKTKIVFQSELKAEHLELFYFLLVHSRLGELKSMTQYKFLMSQFKQSNGTEPELFGVLSYPVLMAADILLYDSSLLSIGEDQLQHLELCSALRERINKTYSLDIFPNSIKPLERQLKTPRIMDLVDPAKKMSKSTTNKDGVIFLTDTKEEIMHKILKAKTDSLNEINIDKANQPGIHNLLSLYSALSNRTISESFELVKTLNYKELKEEIGKIVSDTILSIQERYKTINEEELKKQIRKNTEDLQLRAKGKLEFIYSQLDKLGS